MEGLKSNLKEIRTDIKNWWVLLLLGILFVGAGIWVFINPLGSYTALSVLFAVSMFVSGIFQLWFAITNRNEIAHIMLSLKLKKVNTKIVKFEDLLQ